MRKLVATDRSLASMISRRVLLPPPWGADYQHDLLRTPAPREPLLNGTLTLREDWNEDFGANLKQTDADEKGPNSNRRVTFPGF